MKKYVAILLIAIYVIPLAEVSQLFKFPVLVEHYFEHKEKDENLSLMKFLCMHYYHNHLDDKTHDKLPFKTQDNCHHTNIIGYLPVQHNLELRHLIGIKNIFGYCKTITIPAGYLPSIWQPPKMI